MLARENPFRTEVLQCHRYRFKHGDTMEQLTARFRQMDFRGAIVGPKGRGKTTLLNDFCQHLNESGEITTGLRLNQSQRPQAMALCEELLARAPLQAIVVIDGAEQLGWLQWRKIARRVKPFRGLLVTTHRSGRLAKLVRCETNLELLQDLVRAMAPAEFDEVRQDLDALFRRHRGNFRECLRGLYDQYACR